MNIAALRAELEEDQAWRRDEIRQLQNRTSRIRDSVEQERFRRPIVLLLYAHFEGYCKFAFSLYVSAVNAEGIRCGDAHSCIAAATLDDLFHALRDPNSKDAAFRNILPDDTKLHRFARDREFLERLTEFEDRIVDIPDTVVDMESNLTPVVLRKNLYRLGFKHDQFEDIEGDIHLLLNYRNNIAHGAVKTGITEEAYNTVKNAAFRIMNGITIEITNALQTKQYLRSII